MFIQSRDSCQRDLTFGSAEAFAPRDGFAISILVLAGIQASHAAIESTFNRKRGNGGRTEVPSDRNECAGYRGSAVRPAEQADEHGLNRAEMRTFELSGPGSDLGPIRAVAAASRRPPNSVPASVRSPFLCFSVFRTSSNEHADRRFRHHSNSDVEQPFQKGLRHHSEVKTARARY
jgi:hypothetical protein